MIIQDVEVKRSHNLPAVILSHGLFEDASLNLRQMPLCLCVHEFSCEHAHVHGGLRAQPWLFFLL